MPEPASIPCPRCGRDAVVAFYGPCKSCCTELRARFRTEGRTVEVGDYEPKVNVVANAIATKD